MTTRRISRIATLAWLVAAAPAYAGATIYVDDDAPPGGDGASWDTAYRFLQDALSATEAGGVTEIRVGQGTYEPDRDEANPGGTGDDTASFSLIDAVSIEGGYAGFGASDPDVRDLGATPSILSGDLLRNDEPDFVNYEDNSNQVVRGDDVDVTARLDGFEVRAAGSGGIVISNGQATIVDCRFIAHSGNAARIDSGGPSFLRCAFSDSTGVNGGGAFNEGNVSFTDCVFEDNQAALGGGLYSVGSPHLTRCCFRRNTAITQSGAIEIEGDGHTMLDECTIEDNFSEESIGGVRIAAEATLTGCMFRRNVALQNGGGLQIDAPAVLDTCTFDDNVATLYGGGLYVLARQETVLVIDCVFTGNEATWGGAAAFRNRPDATLIGCAFSANEAMYGGGMYNERTYHVLRACTFAGNLASDGAGMYNNQGFPELSDCLFVANEAADDGGGMMNVIGSAPVILDTTFDGNVARDGGAINGLDSGYGIGTVIAGCTFVRNEAIRGAGLVLFDDDETTISSSVFIDNTASSIGGAVACDDDSDPSITSCAFLGNRATSFGGALHCLGGSDANVTNSVFSGNEATEGGAVRCEFGSNVGFVNCTFTANTATFGDVLSVFSGSDPAMANCIVWANGDDMVDGPGTVTISYSDIEGGFAGVGNVDVDPLFVDADGPDDVAGTPDDDLRLTDGSPVIDAGDNDAVPPGTTTDLDGNPRFVDDPDTVDTGNGTPPVVDLGAYEFQAGCIVDLDGSGAADFGDIVEILAAWGECPPECPEDLDGSGAVDFGDVLAVLAAWGPCL